jgi:predicted aspartyl protease
MMKVGETRATIRLHGEKGSEEVEMLVDTGALYTKISPSLARRLGVVPNEVIKVKLADGSIKEAGLADARVEYGTSKGAIPVLVGPGDELLLGVTTLETLRLKVNPVTCTLEPVVPNLFSSSAERAVVPQLGL